jgi:Polyketide cyclase / dehydrase and lipid transport
MRTALPQLLAILLIGLLGAGAASAMSVESVDITRTGDAYSVAFEVIVAAKAADVHRMLTDYQQWPRLSDNVTEARLVPGAATGAQRISVTLRSCLVSGLFCKVLQQVKDLEALPDGMGYATTFVPGQGDFVSGSESWQIHVESDATTRLRYDATFVPAFHVPRFIGPWMIKRALRRELIGAATKLERLAACGRPECAGQSRVPSPRLATGRGSFASRQSRAGLNVRVSPIHASSSNRLAACAFCLSPRCL